MWYSSNSPTYRLMCHGGDDYTLHKHFSLNSNSAWGGVTHLESLLRCSLHFVAVNVNTT